MDADFILIRKMKQGEEKAFDLFVNKYYGEILKYCSYRCSGKETAEDLTQETFMRFFAKLSDYHHKGKAKNYLYTVAGNLCKDFYKKKQEIATEEMDLMQSMDLGAHPMDDVLNKLTVEWALKQLPSELYEVLILYYFQELKLKEIADILQIGLPLVKYRVKQAKVQLKDVLRKEELDESGRPTQDI